MPNPLIDDRLVNLLLDHVGDVSSLAKLPAFAEHDEDSYRLFLDAARRLARGPLFASYRTLDQEPPRFEGGRIRVHPQLPGLYRELVELGCVAATRPESEGGSGLPQLVYALASAYLMAGNLGVYCYAGLTAGAAHLLEAFGSDELDRLYRQPMLEGRFTGTMALTEPQAGSSLGDVKTSATPVGDGSYRIKGSKIFISGGDHDACENVVHLLLARIDGAPSGSKGISLFCVPNRRFEDGALVDNDVTVAGMIHKIGWKALPSLALEFGDRGDCHGYLVGKEHQGLRHMFQMMNEARLMVGMNGAATASVAYHEARAYALTRPQGRTRPEGPQVPIVEHADVRRMLLRQKAIIDGSFSLLAFVAAEVDRSEHEPDGDRRAEAKALVDLLIPIAKTFPAEFGYEANALAVQIHGGYGYTSEYLPEAFLRDQKLNSIHEGTSGIQANDLLGRKVLGDGGRALAVLGDRIARDVAAARAAGVPEAECAAIERAVARCASLVRTLLARAMEPTTLAHAFDFLTLLSIVVVGWQHLLLARHAAARPVATREDAAFAEGIAAGARYWCRTELPRVEQLADLLESRDDSFVTLAPDAV